jgi:hypothetical protein
MIDCHQFHSRPSVVCNASRNCRCRAVRGVDAAEVEVGGLDEHGPAVVCQLLGVAQSLSGEPAVEKTHVEVLAFRVVDGGQPHVWIANAGFASNRLAYYRVVAPSKTGRMQRAVGFHFRRIVRLFAKGCVNTPCWRGIAFKSVAGDLEPASNRSLKPVQKVGSCVIVPLADVGVENQFSGPVNGKEGILIPAQKIVFAGVLLQATDKAKHFINLNVACLDAFDLVGHELLAVLASRCKHVQNGVFAKPGEPGNSAYADAFTEHLNNLRGLGGLDPHSVKRLPFGERFPAPHTAEPPDNPVSIFKTSEPLRLAVTTNAVHSCLSRATGIKVAANRKIQQLLALPPLVAAWRVLLTLAEPLFHLRANLTKGSWTLAVQVKRKVKVYRLYYQILA